MQRNEGMTFPQVLVVISIIVVLMSSIAYLFGPGLIENSRQDSCKRRLRHIYQALVIYSQDHDFYDDLQGLGPLSLFALGRPIVLRPYLKADKECLFCPDTPECAKRSMASTYQWTFVGFNPNSQSESRRHYTEHIRSRLEKEGDGLPIARCSVHDEVFYQPRESDIEPALSKAFLIDLTISGSIRSARHGILRAQPLKQECSNNR